MTNIWNPDYIGNPNNRRFVYNANLVGMEWKEYKGMYNNLHPEVRMN